MEYKDTFVRGNYLNKCAHCKKQFKDADKMWFLCPECSIIPSISEGYAVLTFNESEPDNEHKLTIWNIKPSDDLSSVDLAELAKDIPHDIPLMAYRASMNEVMAKRLSLFDRDWYRNGYYRGTIIGYLLAIHDLRPSNIRDYNDESVSVIAQKLSELEYKYDDFRGNEKGVDDGHTGEAMRGAFCEGFEQCYQTKPAGWMKAEDVNTMIVAHLNRLTKALSIKRDGNNLIWERDTFMSWNEESSKYEPLTGQQLLEYLNSETLEPKHPELLNNNK